MDKTVCVCNQKHNKANHHGQVGNIFVAGYAPHNNENNIVCTVSKGIKAASAGGQIRRQKGGEHRNRADHQVGGIKCFQQKEKTRR